MMPLTPGQVRAAARRADRVDRAVAVAREWLDAAPEDLSGLCGHAAQVIVRRLSRTGARFVSGSFDGMPHCWADVDGTIVDPTVAQFGQPRTVAVVTPGHPHRSRYTENPS